MHLMHIYIVITYYDSKKSMEDQVIAMEESKFSDPIKPRYSIPFIYHLTRIYVLIFFFAFNLFWLKIDESVNKTSY
jgi:hypothetical protein